MCHFKIFFGPTTVNTVINRWFTVLYRTPLLEGYLVRSIRYHFKDQLWLILEYSLVQLWLDQCYSRLTKISRNVSFQNIFSSIYSNSTVNPRFTVLYRLWPINCGNVSFPNIFLVTLWSFHRKMVILRCYIGSNQILCISQYFFWPTTGNTVIMCHFTVL